MDSPVNNAATPSAVTPALESLTLVGKSGADGATDSARRSTRVRRAPTQYSPPPPTQIKRKRAQKQVPGEDASSADEEGDASSSDNDSDEDSSEDELASPSVARGAGRSRGGRKSTGGAQRAGKTPSKPPQKKSRTIMGAVVTSPQPTAPSTKKTPAKPTPRRGARKSQSAAAGGANGTAVEGLDSLFNSVVDDDDADDLANTWATAYKANNSGAMMAMVNFILKSCGCETEVTTYDIEDSDNAQDRLQDIQDEFQKQQLPDYPIVSKRQQFKRFKHSLTTFISSLIEHINATQLLYTDPALLENMQIWITAMSSSALRPFRHTSTVISLAMITELCEVVTELSSEIANTTKQVEVEKKKARPNAGRVKSLEAKVVDGEEKREIAQNAITEIYESVFVHRYRDVDPKIRAECIHELGLWIVKLPDMFFEASYLRYLGWVLSDTSAQTRVEVVRALSKLYKDRGNVGGLRPFTERFRPRLVEMALQDADAGVRAAAIALLNEIRSVGFLEPDEIDSIGKVLYDSDQRVRDAVADFIADNVNDAYDDQIEEFGGQEEVEDALKSAGDIGDEDFEGHQLSWIKLKCIVDSLARYDQEGAEDSPSSRMNPVWEALSGGTAVAEQSRFTLAGMALWKVFPELQDWIQLAKYVLYDHTAIPQSRSKKANLYNDIRKFCALSAKEDTILLQVLHAAIHSGVTIGDENLHATKSKSKKKTDHIEGRELTSKSMAQLLPRLLKKFGPTPDAAATVLRIVQLISLDVYQDLRQMKIYAALLDDIVKQFLTHADEAVLKEASAALLHTKSFEELEEVTSQKISKLQDDTIAGFAEVTRGKELATAAFGEASLQALCTTVRRLEYLSSIIDCKEALETKPTLSAPPPSTKGRSRKSTGAVEALSEETSLPIDLLMALLSRGTTVDESETELLLRTQKTLNFYFMWKVKALSAKQEEGEMDEDDDQRVAEMRTLKTCQTDLIDVLERILDQREKVDGVKIIATGALLEIYTLGASLSAADDSAAAPFPRSIPAETQKNILNVYLSAEKTFGKVANRALEADSDDEEDEEEEEEEELNDEEEEQKELVHEQRLCQLAAKIVLAVLVEVIDGTTFRPMLLRNKNRLGSSMKEVLRFIDEDAQQPRKKRKVASKAKEALTPAIVEEEEDDEIEDEEEAHENEVAREEQMAQEEEEEHQRRQEEVEDNDGDEEMADADDADE